jgi:predicted phage terminase large subunit-like protein
MDNQIVQHSGTEVDSDLIAKVAAKGKESFFFFCTAILGFDKVTKKIHRPLCKDLERLEQHRRAMIMLPRDWYKTTLASISYPIWRAVNNPEVRVLLVQNTYTNATSKLGAIKQIFEKNELFRACYPDLLPRTGANWSKDSLCVNRKGAYPESTFEGAGTNTEVVSRHYDLIIEDDTVAPSFDHMTGEMMQPTRADVEKCIGWHKLAHPLLIEPGESQILVVGTRWVEDDLLEWIMKNEPHYHITQRAVRENDKGEPDENGHITWAETDEGKPKFNKQILDEIEAALGPYMFSTLYLNKPTAAANMLFKPKWINYYEKAPENLIVFCSVDLASAKLQATSDPDYCVTLTVGVNPDNGHIYVLDYDQDRFNPGEHINSIFNHYRMYKFVELILEGIAYQRTLGYWLEQRQLKTGVMFPVKEIASYSASKEMRIRGLQPYFANNKIFIKTEHKELENELINFPYGRHDDIIDSLSAQIPSWAEVIDESAKRSKYERTYLEGSASYIIDRIQKAQRRQHADYLSGIGNLDGGNEPVLHMKRRNIVLN